MRLKKGSTVSAGRKRPILPLNIVNENGLIWNWRKPIHAFGYEWMNHRFQLGAYGREVIM